MIRRVAAVEATIARFDGLPLTYGKDDCARMVAFALRKQGARVALLKAGQYSSKLGAAKALKKLGEAFASGLVAALRAQGLVEEGAVVTPYASPRRLAARRRSSQSSSPGVMPVIDGRSTCS